MPSMMRNKKAAELNILDKNDLALIIQEIESSESLRRRKKAWKRYQVVEGNQLEYIKDKLAAYYPKTWNKFRVSDINLGKKIIRKFNKAYKLGAIREVPEDQKATDVLNEKYKKFQFNRAFSQADKIFNRDRYVCLWLNYLNPAPALGEIDGQYVLRALAPYEYSLIQDEHTGKPIIFILNYPDSTITEGAGNSDGHEQRTIDSKSDTSANSKIYSIWSRTNYVKIKVSTSMADGHVQRDIEFIEIPGNANNINPIDRLPVSFVSAEGGIDLPVESNIAEQSIDFNVQASDYRTASSSQGHGQLVIEHEEKKKIKDVHGGMHQAITLPQSSKEGAPRSQAYYISANPDLGGMLEALKFEAVNILDDHGISSPKGISADNVVQFASGIDRAISEADVTDKIEDTQKLFSETLEQDIAKIFFAYEAGLKKMQAKDLNLTVKYPKPKVMISDKETLENIRTREELELIEDWEKLIIIDPNLTEEEAKAKLALIRENKKAKLKELGLSEINPDEDDQDDEQDEEKEE